MRINSPTFDARQLAQMGRLSATIAQESERIATGHRYSAASDAPEAAARVDRIARTQADAAAHGRALDLANSRLSSADTALGGISTTIARLSELALAASSDTASPEDRAGYAREVAGLRDELRTLANTRDAGGALVFAGGATGPAAFGADPLTGRTTYSALGGPARLGTGDGSPLAVAYAAPALFGRIEGAGGRDLFAVVDDFAEALAVPAPTTEGPDLAAWRLRLDAGVDGLRAGGARVGDARADVGGTLARVTAERDRLAATGVTLATARGALEDADPAAAITALERARTILQATQRSFARVAGLSLFDVLR